MVDKLGSCRDVPWNYWKEINHAGSVDIKTWNETVHDLDTLRNHSFFCYILKSLWVVTSQEAPSAMQLLTPEIGAVEPGYLCSPAFGAHAYK